MVSFVINGNLKKFRQKYFNELKYISTIEALIYFEVQKYTETHFNRKIIPKYDSIKKSMQKHIDPYNKFSKFTTVNSLFYVPPLYETLRFT